MGSGRVGASGVSVGGGSGPVADIGSSAGRAARPSLAARVAGAEVPRVDLFVVPPGGGRPAALLVTDPVALLVDPVALVVRAHVGIALVGLAQVLVPGGPHLVGSAGSVLRLGREALGLELPLLGLR